MSWAVLQADSKHIHPDLSTMHAIGLNSKPQGTITHNSCRGPSKSAFQDLFKSPCNRQGGNSAVLCRAAAALVASERGNDLEAEEIPPLRHSSAPEISCSPPNGRMSRMQLSQEDSQGKQVKL